MDKNTTQTPEKKTRKPYIKKIKTEEEKPIELVTTKKSIKRKNKREIKPYTKFGIEVLKYFDGKNLDNGTDPIDILLKGKKINWKSDWVIYMTNVTNHGKIMSDERAMESGPSACDNFFDWNKTKKKDFVSKYVKPHFIIMEKKGKNIIYDDESFVEFCDVLGKLE